MPVLTKINTNVIADDAITGDKFAGDAYLENTANQNLSGTYAESRLYTSDAYTLTGDVTVTGHLALGTIADEDVVITQDSTERTITGSGTIETGELLSSKETDLTGMTGVLGSVVTGSPAITGFGTVTTGTIGSGVTFPAGHIIQVKNSYYNTEKSNSTNSWKDTGLEGYISLSSTSNKILVIFSINGVAKETGNTSTYIVSQYKIGTGSWGNDLQYGNRSAMTNTSTKNNIGSVAGTYMISPASLETVGVKFVFASQSNVAAAQVQEQSAYSQLTLMEVVA